MSFLFKNISLNILKINMKKLKVAFYGDSKWALNTLKILLKRKDCILKDVYVRFPHGDQPIKDFCEQNDINYLKIKKINNFFETNKRSYDLGISVSYDQIFREKTILSHRLGIINCHAGNLPDFKGRNVINWALINNQKYLGISSHFVDNEVDTGSIIDSQLIIIEKEDDYNTLLNKAYEICPEIINRSINLIKDKNFEPTLQKKIKEFPIYCSRRIVGDELINWNDSSLNIHNFIRALVYPGPLAQTKINNKKVFIKKSTFINSAPKYIDKPGTILKKDSAGIIVKTGDTYILIKEWICDTLLKVGDRFDNGFNNC